MMTTTMFSGMSPLVLFIAKATLVLLAALLGASALRRSTAGARHLVWLAALVGVLALPVLARIPTLRLSVLPATIGDTRLPMIAATNDAAANDPAGPQLAPTREPAAPIIVGEQSHVAPALGLPQHSTGDVQSIVSTLLVFWAGVALSLLAWLVMGAVKVHRIIESGRELSSVDWTTPLCEVADRLDLEAPPRLVVSDEIEMAFAARALTPTIVLPRTAESWSDDRRRAVLFHELAHIKRHDLIGHTLGRIACALYWFHPLVWTAAKKLRAESERACDDLVLTCGARPSEYAQHLLDMVTSVRRHGAPVMAMPMARKKEFEGRMLAILDPAIRRAAPGRAQALTVIATLGALSLTIAAVAPVRATIGPKPSVGQRREAPSVSRSERQVPRGEEPPSQPATTTTAPASPRVAERAMETTVDVRTQKELSSAVSKFATQFSTVAANAVVSAFTGRAAQASDTARTGLLVKALETDSDPGVRRSAAWALHDLPAAAAKNALVKALRGDADAQVREMSAWALTQFESDETTSALGDALLKDKSPHVRTTSAWALGQFDRSEGVEALISGVNDPEVTVREAAIWALGQHDLRRAPASVINSLTDPSARVRTVAAWTLGQTEDTAAVRPLSRAFETETDSRVRTAELWALTTIGQAPSSVIDAAMRSSDPDLRRRGVAMLAGTSGPWPWPWPWPWPRPMP